MAYMIRPGFLSSGLKPRTEEHEDTIARLIFPGKFKPDEEGKMLPNAPSKTFRTITTTTEYIREYNLTRQAEEAPEPCLVQTPASTPRGRVKQHGKQPRGTRSKDGTFVPALPPPGLYDDVPVPPASVGGLPLLWDMSDTLAKSMAGHLHDLQEDYTNDAIPNHVITNHVIMAGLLKDLIACFEMETKMVEQTKTACNRNYSPQTLIILPPYHDAVVTMRVRLNKWLGAWWIHDNLRNNGQQQGAYPTTGDDDRNKDQGEHMEEVVLLQHLIDWLAEVKSLPPYPDNMPLYPSLDPTQPRMNFQPTKIYAPTVVQSEYRGPRKPRDAWIKRYDGVQTLDIFDYRTDGRRAVDMRSKQDTASLPPSSLLEEAIRKQRDADTRENEELAKKTIGDSHDKYEKAQAFKKADKQARKEAARMALQLKAARLQKAVEIEKQVRMAKKKAERRKDGRQGEGDRSEGTRALPRDDKTVVKGR